MTKQEHTLIHIAEECAEIIKVVSKALRFGIDHKPKGKRFTNRALLVRELADLRAVEAYARMTKVIKKSKDGGRHHRAKIRKIVKYRKVSKRLKSLAEVSWDMCNPLSDV